MRDNEMIPYEDIYSEIKEALLTSRSQAYTAVNFTMVQAYWQIGRIIVEHITGFFIDEFIFFTHIFPLT